MKNHVDSLKFVFNELSCQPDTFTTRLIDEVGVFDVVPFYRNPSFYLSVISIFIAVLAILVPWIKDKIDESNRLTDLKKYVNYLLLEIRSNINDRLQNLEKISEIFLDIENKTIEETSSLEWALKNFIKIPYNDLYNIFIHKRNKSTEEARIYFSKLVKAIDFSSKQQEILQRNLLQYFHDRRNYDHLISDNIDLFLSHFRAHRTDSINESDFSKEDRFIWDIDSVVNKWAALKKEKFYQALEILLKNSKEIIVENISNSKAIELLNFINAANDAYQQILDMNSTYRTQILEQIEQSREMHQWISDALLFFYEIE